MIAYTEDRIEIVPSSRISPLIIKEDRETGGVWIQGHEIPRSDVEDMVKLIQNYLRTGFFDGRVRT